jgi:peptidoglycan/LPS O-acetylase OafA/YrhL
VTDYRLWSADPQIHSYAYQLLAEVLLMLCAFHRTSCDGGILQRRKLLFTGLAAAVCAMAALSMDFHRPFFLASALWGLGCIGTTAVLPPDPKEEPENPEQTETPEE